MGAFSGTVLVIVLGLIVWLASRTSTLERQVKALEGELQVTRRRLNSVVPGTVTAPEESGDEPRVDRTPVLPARQSRAAPQTITTDVPALAIPVLEELTPDFGIAALMAENLATRPAPRSPSVVTKWWQRARATGEWEALIGGNWLNRVGAVALMLGIAFFLKYAFDNNWIKQGAQVGVGLALGTALLGLARRTHSDGYAVFSQGLLGSGLGILYLSLYASYNVYALVPLAVAFVALAALIAIAFYQSLYYDSMAVAILAWGGGFLTPFLLGASAGSPVGVVAYVVLLDIGILGIVFKRDAWVALEGLSLAATYAVYLTWFIRSYQDSQIVIAGSALTLFWLVFYGLDAWRIQSGATTHVKARARAASANMLAYYALMFLLVFPSSRWAMGCVSLAIGAVYLVTILALRRRLQQADAVDARFTLTALTLLLVATALVTAGFTTVILWSAEGLGLLWAGVRWNLWYVWRPAVVTYGLAAVLLPATPNALLYIPLRTIVPILNLRLLAFLALAAALVMGTIVIRRLRDPYAERIWTSFHYGWCGVAFVLLGVETNDLFRRTMQSVSGNTLTAIGYYRFLALAAVWMALALALVWLGLRRRIGPILISGLGCAALGTGLGAATGAAYQPVQRFVPLLNARAALLCVLIAALFVHTRWLRAGGHAYAWTGIVRIVFQTASILLGFELVTAEANDAFAHAAGNQSQTTHDVGLFIEFVALGLIWMTYSLFLVVNGVRRSSRTLLVSGLGCAGFAICAGTYCGFAAQPADRLPLALGARTVMLPVLMLGLYLHMRWMKDARALFRWIDGVLVAFQAAMVLLGFELLTGETRDFFDHLVSTSSRRLSDSTQLRNLEQLALSGLWLLYAIVLMAIGLWRRTRWLRFGSIALFGFIILKIFGYDLSFLQGLYRSVSFAGLGLILLAVSYLYSRYHSLLLEA